MQIMDFEQIRINAVLGVCARQRELVAENRKLRAKKQDEIVASVAFAVAFTIMVVCLVM